MADGDSGNELNPERNHSPQGQARQRAQRSEEVVAHTGQERGHDQVAPNRIARIRLRWMEIRVNANFVIAGPPAFKTSGRSVLQGSSAMSARFHANSYSHRISRAFRFPSVT